jgi:hypothetical protein
MSKHCRRKIASLDAPFVSAFTSVSLLCNAQRPRHLLVAAAAENIASERELTRLVGRKMEARDDAGFDISTNAKIGQAESMSDILRRHFKNY